MGKKRITAHWHSFLGSPLRSESNIGCSLCRQMGRKQYEKKIEDEWDMVENIETHAVERTIDDHFIDWINEVIGLGYGSGEPHTIPALRKFLSLCTNGPNERAYDYEELEHNLGAVAAWLLIDILCQNGITEYGSSPRYAWLTDDGIRLRDYMLSYTPEHLVDLYCNKSYDHPCCTVDYCNCGPVGYSEKKLCHNPFWKERQ